VAEMNILESLDDLGFKNFKKLIDIIIPRHEREKNKIIINYVRINNHLNTAFELLNRDDCSRGFEYLLISRKILKQMKFGNEASYLKRIAKILDSLLKRKSMIISRLKKDEASDPFHVKTQVMLAQNICILRILKITKFQ
jgi:hypothetical protein